MSDISNTCEEPVKQFIAVVKGYDQQAGVGDSLKTAFDDLKDQISEEPDMGDVKFYEAVEIEVEVQIVKVDTVKAIKRKQ